MLKINQYKLKEILNYNPETGIFTWLVDRYSNKVKGKQAGSNKEGYTIIYIDKKPFRAHSLAWLYVYGFIPKEIDHINRNKSDNRLCNLRVTDRFKNCQNRNLAVSNKTGVSGVSFSRKTKKWIAQITVNRKFHYLGCFSGFDDAVNARKKAEIELRFGENNA